MSIFIEKYDPAYVESGKIMLKEKKFSPWFWGGSFIFLAIAMLGFFDIGFLFFSGGVLFLSLLSLIASYATINDRERREMRNDLRPISRKRLELDSYSTSFSYRTKAKEIVAYRIALVNYLDAIRGGAARNYMVEEYLSDLANEAENVLNVIEKASQNELNYMIDENVLENLKETRKQMEEML